MAQFKKGSPGGPGRPRGSRNKSTIWFDTIGSKATAKAIKAVTDKAAKGDMWAAGILLARTWPRRRGRPVTFELPALQETADLIRAQAVLVAAVARGQLTPEEAADVSTLVENQRRAVETHDHERRIAELEEKKAVQPVKYDPVWVGDDDDLAA